jgi:hypothetical protein
MPTANNPTSNAFDLSRFDYSIGYDTPYPPTLLNIKSGFNNYYGMSVTDASRVSPPYVGGNPYVTAKEYTLWLEGFFERVLAKVRADAEALREAQKIMDENPQFVRMLDLYKRGLL